MLGTVWCVKMGWGSAKRRKVCAFSFSAVRDCLRMTCRYANMDFCLMATLVGTFMISLVVSYDVVCQWSRNFVRRVGQFPLWMQLPQQVLDSITYVIPKFHISGHGSACQTKFSLNYNQYSARTNGEEPEQWWAHINPVSMSTREMGPGSRHDTVDDHAAAWNWGKITNFGNDYHQLCDICEC